MALSGALPGALSSVGLIGARTPVGRRYDEAEGLVPPSVLGHIVRYGLYARVDEEVAKNPP